MMAGNPGEMSSWGISQSFPDTYNYVLTIDTTDPRTQSQWCGRRKCMMLVYKSTVSCTGGGIDLNNGSGQYTLCF
jgi:hypothetical protein